MTHFYVLRFVQSSDGKLVAAECEEKTTGMAAVDCACAYATGRGGAVAFSRQGELSSSDVPQCSIIAGLGLLPDDLETFL
ncbi:MAG: hypothetical protein JOZ88_01135 [Hyphomicrobiales bacterium]|nr:hypothetical protein [Hyphomicrobiales bacterium]